MIGINQVNRGEKRSKLPEVPFSTLAKLERYRSICLGLPVPSSPLKPPYGYVEDPETGMLEPIEEVIQLLLKAKHYIRRGYPYTKVTEWLNINAEQYIDETIKPGTLRWIMNNRPPFEECALPRDEREQL